MDQRLPTSTLAGAIDIYEGIWAEPQQTINKIEEACAAGTMAWEIPETVSYTINGPEEVDVHTYQYLGITTSSKKEIPAARETFNQYQEVLGAVIPNYRERYGLHELFQENIMLLKYGTGEHFGRHFDGGIGTNRCVSAVLYLNDDYDGGEIEFIHFGIKLKPAAGTLLLFPSDYAYEHRVHELKNGVRYTAPTWFHDMPLEYSSIPGYRS